MTKEETSTITVRMINCEAQRSTNQVFFTSIDFFDLTWYASQCSLRLQQPKFFLRTYSILQINSFKPALRSIKISSKVMSDMPFSNSSKPRPNADVHEQLLHIFDHESVVFD